MLPIAGGVIFLMMIAFALYVRSVPPKQPTITIQQSPPDLGQSSINDDPMLQEALKEAEEALKKMKAEEEEAAAATASGGSEAGETIEL